MCACVCVCVCVLHKTLLTFWYIHTHTHTSSVFIFWWGNPSDIFFSFVPLCRFHNFSNGAVLHFYYTYSLFKKQMHLFYSGLRKEMEPSSTVSEICLLYGWRLNLNIIFERWNSALEARSGLCWASEHQWRADLHRRKHWTAAQPGREVGSACAESLPIAL